ncbi:hypothetical protein COY28_00765 [Candidatus Woesearchaeota archaeon CG_4_10_14_0_2_um_filter_57_5]|nr:MAG: hypothetical protein AUJ68_03205 [Candidatus Woesearchaeota archaeon CG1_02_57_44]PIZ56725.1 MAG: hypothetical protein COY28_00765 [Candidatus Woesearchaeota archaeon CG_4_10_14_0_2_um_filter_57_5]
MSASSRPLSKGRGKVWTQVVGLLLVLSTLVPLYLFAGPGSIGSAVQTAGPEGEPINLPPVIGPLADVRIDAGQPLAFQVQAADPEGQALTYVSDNLPEDATFDGQTGAFYWQTAEQDIGEHLLRFAVSDRVQTATASLLVQVVSPNRPPILRIDASPRSGSSPLTVHLSAQVTDPDNDAVGVEWHIDTSDVRFGAQVDYTFKAPGMHVIRAVARDAHGNMVWDDLSISASDPADAPASTTMPASSSDGYGPQDADAVATGLDEYDLYSGFARYDAPSEPGAASEQDGASAQLPQPDAPLASPPARAAIVPLAQQFPQGDAASASAQMPAQETSWSSHGQEASLSSPAGHPWVFFLIAFGFTMLLGGLLVQKLLAPAPASGTALLDAQDPAVRQAVTYVVRTAQVGYSWDVARQQLLTQGWDEDQVGSVMRLAWDHLHRRH